MYVSHNAVGTPLVRSQVLPYLRGLIERGAIIELVTFERGDAAFPDGEFPRDRWHPLSARPGASMLAKAIDIARGIALVARLVREGRADVIHARSYVPAAIALVAGLLTRVPFVFDMRGFLPDEYVEGGNWRAGEVRDRALRLAERLILRRAREIVVLTHVAARRLRSEPRFADAVGRTVVTVVPCGVDLARFRPRDDRDEVPTLLYSGSLGLWYELDEMLRVYASAREHAPGLRFLFLSPGEGPAIRDAVRRLGLERTDVRISSAPYERVHEHVARSHVGIILLRQVSSKSGSSAVKIAEYLACGLPVLVDRGHGDVAGLVERYGAGCVLRAYSSGEIARAGRALAALLGDVRARAAARRLAEDEYDVRRGTAAYAEIYARIAARA